MQRLVIGFIIFVVLSLVIKVVKGLKKTVAILGSKKYRKNPAGSELSKDQQTALCVGAINGEQTMYYTDTLETGDPLGDTAEKLEDYYGVNSETSAESILKWLYHEGQRGYFEVVKQVVADPGNKEYRVKVEEQFADEQLKKCLEYIDNLEECLEDLVERGFLKSRCDIADISIAAWDLGRLVNVTRACFECKYVTKDQAWSIISSAYEESKKVYDNWQEFAAGYIIGRAMWSGDNISLTGLKNITDGLLNDEDSPWTQYPFK